MNFADEIEQARMMLRVDFRGVTVSASQWRNSTFVSVKSPHWTHEMEWREGDAPNMPLSKWIYRMVRLSHAPDIAKAAHSGEGERGGSE